MNLPAQTDLEMAGPDSKTIPPDSEMATISEMVTIW